MITREAVSKYLSYCKDELSEETIQAKIYDLAFFCLDKSLKSITLDDIYSHVSKMPDWRRWRALINIKAFFKWCQINDLECINYLKIRCKRPQENKQELITQDEFDLLDAQCHILMRDRRWVRLHAVLHLLWETGIRRKELLNIQVRDLDVKNKTFWVETAKGGRPRYCYFMFDIQPYLNKYKPKDKLFNLSKRQVGHLSEVLCVKAGITKHISAHSFRRGYITRMLQNGADVTDVAFLAGHKKLNTTLGYYGPSCDRLKDVYDLYNNAPKTLKLSTGVGRRTRYNLEVRLTKNKQCERR